MGSNEEVSPELIHKAIDPLPYFPTLCRLLGGVTISIVLVYLEIHHSPLEPDPTTQPARAGLRIPPVYLDCDRACEDLGIARRTLHTALDGLATWWKNEGARSAASRSGREFLAASHALDRGKLERIRPYAIVGSRKYNQHRIIAVHRNYPRLDQLASDSGVLPPQPINARVPIESTTYPSQHLTDTPATVLESLLGVSAKRGLGWGWSQERVAAQSARMTELWAKRREKGL